MATSRKKVHAPAGPRGESGLTLTLCGRLEGDAALATTAEEITCAICARKFTAVGVPPSAEWRPHEPGTRYDPRYDSIAFASVPGRRDYWHRWPSVERALREYVITLHDGFISKSVTAGLVQFARLGAQVQGGSKSATRAVLQAEDAVAVDRALRWACSHRQVPDAATQRVIVLARVVGEHRVAKRRTRSGHAVDDWAPVMPERLAAEFVIDESEIASVVREVKRWLRIDLGARGLVPVAHGSRNVMATEERQRELAARRTA